MERINELIVVEGKHDKARLTALYDCDVICTEGLALDENALKLIKQADSKQGVIVLTDPDVPGEKIRKAIMEIAPNAKHVFIQKKDCIGKRNVGVEYASDETIKQALANSVTFTNKNESITWQQYCNLGIMGNKNKRMKLCENLNIGYCNNKTLFKRLNMLAISYEEAKAAIK